MGLDAYEPDPAYRNFVATPLSRRRKSRRGDRRALRQSMSISQIRRNIVPEAGADRIQRYNLHRTFDVLNHTWI